MRNTLLPAQILVLTSLLGAQDPNTTYHVRVDQTLTAIQHQLLHARYGGDCTSRSGGPVELYLHPDEYAELKKLGIRTKVLGRGRPYQEIINQQKKYVDVPPDSRYFTDTEILAEIDKFAKAYPKIARRVDVTALTKTAKTHGSRSIYALKVSDNVASDEDEPAQLIASQHHARELNTPVQVFGAIDRILKGYATNQAIKRLVDSTELYFVPCVNPDGVNLVWTRDRWWRKNGRGNYGVDLNRNFPFLWGRCGTSSSTSSQIYKGPSAASEPETKTMMALSRMLRPEIYLDFHSYGREVLFTYAPCATVNSSIRAMINTYANDLRAPMSYAYRPPSASGEAPEWHWADGGAMSFLIETMTSFQPTYTSAVAEVNRTWPGVLRATTTWRPAVRGHVRSIFKNQPIAATIRYTPNRFSHGEKGASRARDGRYGLWLPIGTHQVTWSAPGFRSVTRTVRVTSYNNPQNIEIQMIPNMATPTISKSGTDRIGTTTKITYRSTADVGEQYWILLSLGTTPGIDLGAGRKLPLNFDPAMDASIFGGVLRNNFGQIPGGGQVTADFPIPRIPAFVGLRLYTGGVTANVNWLANVKNYSAAISFTIKP